MFEVKRTYYNGEIINSTRLKNFDRTTDRPTYLPTCITTCRDMFLKQTQKTLYELSTFSEKGSSKKLVSELQPDKDKILCSRIMWNIWIFSDL